MRCVCAVLLFVTLIHAGDRAFGVTFKLAGQLDAAALGVGVPGSIAARGEHLFVGNLTGGGKLHHVLNPLTNPTKVSTFGGLNDPATNGGLPVLANPVADTTSDGYVSLHTDGTTLVAATTNGGMVDNSFGVPATGRADVIQAYSVASGTLLWGGNSDLLQIGGPGYQNQGNFFDDLSIEGAAVDPHTGRIVALAWGSAEQYLFEPSPPPALASVFPNPNILTINNTTGWRDVSFSPGGEDLVAIGVDGIVRGKRLANGEHRYTQVTNPAVAGVERIVNFNAFGFPFAKEFSTATNVEFLPAQFAGQELVIFNKRNKPDIFAEQVLVYDASVPNTPVAASFVLGDGATPFTTPDASTGIYDFSYDEVNNRLFVSDFSSSQIYVFAPLLPEPGDLTGDGKVDGADVLQWQRGFGSLYDASTLAEVLAHFGMAAVAASASSIPEPSAIASLGQALACLAAARVGRSARRCGRGVRRL